VDVDDIAFSCSLFSDKVVNTDGLNQLRMDAFGCTVQGLFLTHNVLSRPSIERESLMQRILHDWIILGLIDLFANASSVNSYENH